MTPARAGIGGGIGLVVMVVFALLAGVDPGTILNQVIVEQTGAPSGGPPPDAADDESAQFISVVLAETETVWGELFAAADSRYEEPQLVLFSNAVESACGFASAAVGPFYCPGDHKVYLDLSFFDDLRTRFGAPGDFAQAYVVAHEVGHHVQNLLGVAGEIRARQASADQATANALSVRLELQADCLAGVWAHHADRGRELLEPGDIEEGLAAAAAIGDDRLQRQSQGRVSPDSFTHGSSAQRVQWFTTGYRGGEPGGCDTFEAAP
jgi:hypothetical protein